MEEFVQVNYTVQEFSEMVRRKKSELLQMTHWKRIYSLHSDSFDSVAERQTKADLAGRIGLLSFEEFQTIYASSRGEATPVDLEDSCSTPIPSTEENQTTVLLKA